LKVNVHIVAEAETTPEIICKPQVVSQLASLYFLTSICPNKPHGKRKGQRILNIVCV